MDRKGPIRILLAKIGLDVHDIGLRMLARVLRDAGMEVVYLGIHQTPESIATTAIQEDVHVVGISSHCGTHVPALTELVKLLREKGTLDIPVVCGGMIPAQDRPTLSNLNIKAVFGPGTPFEDIIESIEELIEACWSEEEPRQKCGAMDNGK